ncbi:MAG: CBS domain-containing protein [Candidatus Dadabacteria bacterium]|nr:MAG: CBS domain-containing protein [Candidatus Dadabacteria bacterium]
MKTARDIMTRDVLTVRPGTPLKELSRLFIEKKVSGFPVVDEKGSLRGVVTEGDLLHQNQRLHIPTAITIFDAVIVLGSSKKLEEELRRMAATTVEEIMTPDPVTVTEDTPVEEVARIMAERHIHTLPVLDAEGRLAGVIGKVDVIRAMGGG